MTQDPSPPDTDGPPVGTPSQPLQGLRVIELSSYVAAPLCGVTLAQLGADVVRVEPPGGTNDRSRWPLAEGGQSLYWDGLNLGKRAIEVALDEPGGTDLVADLVCAGGSGGGVLVTNSTRYPALSYESLAARRPDVIHVQLVGRRDGGTSVDYLAQVRSGMPLITGHPDAGGQPAEPVNQVLPAWDVVAGLYLATGLMAAERHRALTGAGQSIRIALEDVALSTLSTLGYYADAHLNGTERAPIGNEVYGSLGRDVLTADGVRLYLLVLTPRHWHDLLDLTGLGDEMAEVERDVDGDFGSESDRFTHRHRIFALLEPWFAAHSWAEVSDGLSRTKVLWARYRSFRDVVAQDGAALREDPMFHEVDQPGVGPLLRAGMPLMMDGRDSVPAAAPAVGQHTQDVMTEVLGLAPPTGVAPSTGSAPSTDSPLRPTRPFDPRSER